MGKRNPITFILIILALGYGGSIVWLNNLQKKSIIIAQGKIASLGDINQNVDINKLRAARNQLPKAIAILEQAIQLPGIPLQPVSREIVKLNYQLTAIERKLYLEEYGFIYLKLAKESAMAAALLVQNPPHPIKTWYKAQEKWQYAINLLEKIPQESGSYLEAREKLKLYRENYQVITKRFNWAKQAIEINNQAKQKMEKGNYWGAIRDLKKAINLNPGQSETYLSRGVAYSQVGMRRAAIADFNKAIEINPGNSQAYYYRGDEYLQLGDKQKALEDLNKSIKIDANNPKSYFNRGVVYYLRGNQSKAIENFQQAAFLFGLDGDSESQKMAVDMLKRFQE
ncbi:MAG: tetratricopeptide repeat protein [Okeania sp. SIO2F4]|uniref:tetratricopeptide repeat protein n=1 Tax=Okeania sp. SIO2F4 TaxID=2607790 RepID=UPI00142B15BD|nr:tetratricopeptide repeat protein [Okeania sp. SIO2F4]NES03589.1 tetratricopeptide repeat protein [Okeania sp. SIO2F4]